MSAETRSESNVLASAASMNWILALLGVWVLITPFFLGPATDSAIWDLSGSWLFWSNVVAGVAITAIAGLSAYTESAAE